MRQILIHLDSTLSRVIATMKTKVCHQVATKSHAGSFTHSLKAARAGAAAPGECELVVLQGNYIKDGHQLTHPSLPAEAGELVPCGGTSA